MPPNSQSKPESRRRFLIQVPAVTSVIAGCGSDQGLTIHADDEKTGGGTQAPPDNAGGANNFDSSQSPPPATTPAGSPPASLAAPEMLPARVGSSPNATNGQWDEIPTAFTRSFLLDGIEIEPTYVFENADIGKSVKVRVQASNGDQTSAPVDSQPTSVVYADTLPSWVPPPGQFSNIALNNLNDATPVNFPKTDRPGPFTNWSGGVFADSFSNLGALCIYGSGHLNVGATLFSGVWCFNLDTRQWEGRNVPGAPVREGGPLNEYGESLAADTLGHLYPPHMYDGLVYQPPAFGGVAPAGSMVKFFTGGSRRKNSVHAFDLNSPSAPPARRVDSVPLSVSTGAYPQTALDKSRSCIWVLHYNGSGPLHRINLPDFSYDSFPVGFAVYGDHAMIYVPAPWDVLVSLGRTESDAGGAMGLRVCKFVNGVPQGFVSVTQNGPTPSDTRCGGVWSTILNQIVCYEAGGSSTVHRLTPPSPGNETTGTWTWTPETLTGVSGVAPAKGNAFGAYSRFVEAPSIRSFLWCESVSHSVQAWRLQGM